MLKKLKRARDRFFGIGEADTSVPVMDGPLKPNNILENADVFFERADLEDMAVDGEGRLFAAVGQEILQISQAGVAEVVAQLNARVQALAMAHGDLVAATRDGLHYILGPHAGRQVSTLSGANLRCINALSEGADGLLLVSVGSEKNDHDHWQADLLTHGSSGTIVAYDLQGNESRVLASGLRYSFGVCRHGQQLLFSESWAHRVIVHGTGVTYPGPSEIPGYPSRISPASGGGYWLTIFAPRNQLLEFVLREDAFRKEMMSTVEPRYWIAPAIQSGADFLEPLQQGGVRQMGILKPWAPARSYGLVLRLSSDLVPLYSMHSRVGGQHHGIVAAQEFQGALIVLSKGAGRLLRVAIPHQISKG